MAAHTARGLLALLTAIAALFVAVPAQAQTAAMGCDPLDPAVCLQPWPNDYFTTPDATTDTGRRLNLNILGMPRNIANNPIRPDDWNRNDGFSPGQKIVTRVPGLDTPAAFQNTGAVPVTDMAQFRRADQPVVVINAATRKRHLIWAEIDSNPTNPSDVNLIIRPGVNFEEGARYIVALRSLRDASGGLIEAQLPFRTYRDNIPSTDPAVEARRPHMESIFNTLRQAGIDQDELYLAWDFTVASQRNLSERALSIRDDAFAQLGDTNLGDLSVAGHLTDIHRHHRHELHGGGGRQDRAQGRRHVRGSVLSEPAGLPAEFPLRVCAGVVGSPCARPVTRSLPISRA